MAKKIIPFIIIAIFSFIAGFALLQKGMMPTHDGEYHVVRFYEFDKVLRSNTLYPRWAPDLNYGYGVPLFNYVYPLPNYAAFLLHAVGFSFIDSFKVSLFIGLLLSGIFFYLWAKEFWGKVGGVVSAIFYIFSPYHFVDIYIRGSVGEVWAMAFFPLFLWLLTKYINTKKLYFLPLGSLVLALVIFSHNILGLMFFIFSIVYAGLLITILKKRKEVIPRAAGLFILGIILSAVFWVPALFEAQYVRGLQVFDINKNFPQFYQLLIPSWGSGFSGGSLQNQMSFQIGIGNLFAVSLGFITLLFYFKRKDKRWIHVLFFLVLFFIACLFMLKISLFLWMAIPLLNYFQFPWRILSIVIIVCSFLAGSIFGLLKGEVKKIFLAACLILIVVSLSMGYANVAYYLMRDDSYYITRSNFIDGTNSPGEAFNTLWMKKITKRPNGKVVLQQGTVIEKEITPTRYRYVLMLPKGGEAIISIAYFPGWKILVNNKEYPFTRGDLGELKIVLPKGKHEVVVVFLDTSVRQIATYLSFASFLGVILLLLKSYSDIIKK